MTIKTLDQLSQILQSDNIYIRWSRGYALDIRQGTSKDYQTSQKHCGLSAVKTSPEWTQCKKRLSRRILEYRFLRIKDEKIKCHIYTATQCGIDTDGYELITNIALIGTLSEHLINVLRQQ